MQTHGHRGVEAVLEGTPFDAAAVGGPLFSADLGDVLTAAVAPCGDQVADGVERDLIPQKRLRVEVVHGVTEQRVQLAQAFGEGRGLRVGRGWVRRPAGG